MFCVFMIIVGLLYIFWDVNYFIRIAVTIGLGRLLDKRRNLNETSTIYGFCTTNDVDIFLRHMNNARYIRELDFARFHFYDRTGIYENIKAVDGHAMQGASNIRYRRTIPIFTAYRIETRLIFWDDKAIYIEQKFITVSDNFVRAIALSKQNIIGVEVDALFKGLKGTEVKPQCPLELTQWLSSIETSSAKLRKDVKPSTD